MADRSPHSAVVLRTIDLHKSFDGLTVLKGTSLELRQGEVVLLRGDNGSGKTTLLNILTGNLEPDSGVVELFIKSSTEKFLFPRRWWQLLNPLDHFTPERVAAAGVGRSWQDIRLFATHNLRDNISVATPDQIGENPAWAILRPFAIKRQEKANINESSDTLAALGLEGRETSSADHISLGQAKRVAIARAVRAGAKILFLDEPLAGLDAHGVEQVMSLLKTIARDHKITLVIIEHVFHIRRLLDLITTAWTLDDGRLRIQSINESREELEKASNDGLRKWMMEVAGADGKINDISLSDGAILSVITPSGNRRRNTILKVNNLVVRRGNRLVIGSDSSKNADGLSFALHEGELAVLQANNGWGKTTLLEAIAGLIPITSGTITLHGLPIQLLSPWDRAQCGLSFLQARNHIFPSLTVEESLTLAGVKEEVGNLRQLSSRKMADLSGGQRQHIALICAISSEKQKQMNLLDEPFSMLDQRAILKLQGFLKPTLDSSTLIAVPKLTEFAD